VRALFANCLNNL